MHRKLHNLEVFSSRIHTAIGTISSVRSSFFLHLRVSIRSIGCCYSVRQKIPGKETSKTGEVRPAETGSLCS